MKDHLALHSAWVMKAGGLRWMHDHAHRHYKKVNNRFCYASIVLSTISGVGGFGSQSIPHGPTAQIMLYTIATLNIVNGLLTSFQKFVCAAEKSELHGNVGRQYATFVRNHTMQQHMLATDVTLDDATREARLREVMVDLRSEYERIHAISPTVPHKIVMEFKRAFPNCKHPPEIANGLTDLDHEAREEVVPPRTDASSFWRRVRLSFGSASSAGGATARFAL